jgi:hypothetical protein
MEEKLNSEIEELFESIASKIKDKKLVESIRELARLRYQQGVTFPPLGIDEKLMMTGQEWYDRFKTELVDNYDLRSSESTYVQAIKAGMKAAGIE